MSEECLRGEAGAGVLTQEQEGARRGKKEELGFSLNKLIGVWRKEEKSEESKMPEVDRLKMVTDPARKPSQNER